MRFENEDWYKAQTVRLKALQQAGWVFSRPDIPGGISIQMDRGNRRCVCVISNMLTYRAVQTGLLEVCERFATIELANGDLKGD